MKIMFPLESCDCECSTHPCINKAAKTITILLHDPKNNVFSAILADIAPSGAYGNEFILHEPLLPAYRHYYFPIMTKLTPVSYIQRVTEMAFEYVKLWYPLSACRDEMSRLILNQVVLIDKHKFHSIAEVNRKYPQDIAPNRFAMSYWSTYLEERDFGPKANILQFFLLCPLMKSFDLKTCLLLPQLVPNLDNKPTELVTHTLPCAKDAAPESNTLESKDAAPESNTLESKDATPESNDDLTKDSIGLDAKHPESVSPDPNPLDTPEVRKAFESMKTIYYEMFLKPPPPPISYYDLSKKEQKKFRQRRSFW